MKEKERALGRVLVGPFVRVFTFEKPRVRSL